MPEIVFRGTSATNKSSRNGYKPIAICNHITGGTASSAHNWFTSTGNEVSSAHYIVTKKGEIWQYVDLASMAWANGVKMSTINDPNLQSKLAPLVKKMQTNPNYYTVSIEHEGTDGELTEAQFQATVWLHKHIRDEVKQRFGSDIVFNRDNILGHYQIDPIRKPYCPGPKFPWDRLIKALTVQERPMFTSTVDGENFPSFYEGGGTHILWTVVKQLGLNYQVGNNGAFIIEGRTVQGVVYDGHTYLPWASLIPGGLEPIQKGANWEFLRKSKVKVNGKEFTGFLVEGNNLVPVKSVATAVGKEKLVGWDADCNKVILGGKLLDTTRVVDGTGYAWVREVAEVLDLSAAWDGKTFTVTLT